MAIVGDLITGGMKDRASRPEERGVIRVPLGFASSILPGVFATGATREEAEENVGEAIRLCVQK